MKDFFKRNLLLFIVFITGAAVLVVEVIAVRILSPYFGNTMFTVSSVLGVILAALSLGYYYGGKMADKYPSEKLFFGIIFVSGASILFLQFLNIIVLPILGYALSINSGPLISSVILFFIPALLMGTLSPLVIKLQHLRIPEKGIGTISGQVFFWSTLGSIFGSLFTGFVLIPHFGIDHIVLTTGIILIVLGLLPIAIMTGTKKLIARLIILLVIAGGLMAFSQSVKSNSGFLYQKDGVYERLLIYDDEYQGRPARFFVQDRSSSGAMFLDGDDLAFEYTKYYSLYKTFKPEAKEFLAIGGGIYSVPKQILNELPEANVDVVEIEPELEKLAKEYFELPDDPRLTTYIEDGRRYLHDTDKQYDVIFSDVYFSIYSVPTHFTTQEFYQLAKEKLSDDGIFVANFIGSLSRQKPSLLLTEMKTFDSVFDNTYYFATRSPARSSMQNIIFVGVNGDKKIDWSAEEILAIDDPIIQKAGQQIINTDRFDFSEYPILTDNYAPVDYLTAISLNRDIKESEEMFVGEEILALVEQQLNYGPRYLSATGHERVKDFLIAESSLADEVVVQSWTHQDEAGHEFDMANVIARFNPESERRIVLGGHYDSKKLAHNDLEFSDRPVPGANDSASGTAVLLDLIRQISLNKDHFTFGIDIVFFDGEEGEEHVTDDFSQWQALGANYFVNNLSELYADQLPESAIILDMVCQEGLSLKPEASSLTDAPELTNAFWQSATESSSSIFSNEAQGIIVDDHTFLQGAGIDSTLLIDFDYPYFHTTEDTLDKCSADSLEAVTRAVFDYIYDL